jgi:hypothetical protein
VGDAHDFDNAFYFAPIQQRELRVAYVGRDRSDDPQSLRFFLERVWTETPRRKVIFEQLSAEAPVAFAATDPSRVVILSSPLPPAGLEAVRGFVRGGGTALLVVPDSETAESLVALTSGVRLVSDGAAAAPKAGAYALLSDIDFRHPVFASFAGPRYNDFTKVRFWKHQRFEVDESARAAVLARFDNGDPAMWEQPLGSGKLLWLACGWRPVESQLALSSKFVPMLSRILDHLGGIESKPPPTWRVFQPIALPTLEGAGETFLSRPDGSTVSLPAGADPYREADLPGLYRLQRGSVRAEFAVNLDPAESDTAALSPDHFEQLGVRIGRGPTHEEQLERQRQMRDTELESRQKLWRWLLVGVLGVLALETVLAGRAARRAASHESVQSAGEPPPAESLAGEPMTANR